MKLLYFCIQMDQLGGVAKIESEKINWLVGHGYEVTMCDIEDKEIKPAYPLDERVKIVQGNISTTPGGVFTRLKGVLNAVRRTREIIQEEKPDVIVNAHCPLVTWIIPWVKGERSKVKGERSMVMTIAEMHQSRQGLEVFNQKFMSHFGQWLHRWSIRWIYGRYDKFVCLTTEDAAAWQLKNAVTIPNFTSLSLSEADNKIQNTSIGSEQAPPQKTSHQIIMLARLMPQKRIDLMIQAWALLAKDFPEWHVKVLGEGMERASLEKQIEEAGLKDSFLLPGGVSDVREELSKSDILCLTSEYEGFGIVLIEAMTLGVPVVAMEYVGVHDIIENRKDGLIVPFGDVEGYASCLRALMTNPSRREELAKNALCSVRKFDKEQVMQKWVELFSF